MLPRHGTSASSVEPRPDRGRGLTDPAKGLPPMQRNFRSRFAAANAESGKWPTYRISKESVMSIGRKLLLESLVGHFALLEAAYPRKASTPVARRARRHAKQTLKLYEAPAQRIA